MGSWMLWKIQVKKDKLTEFLKLGTSIDFNILKMYVSDGYSNEIYHSDYYGYAEPVEFYYKHKDLIDDLWWIPISDSDRLIGRNMKTKWDSAKKEYGEIDWEDYW